ncbi:MAG: hypothetical protein AAF399_23680 [Bacteroidota bacterium]
MTKDLSEIQDTLKDILKAHLGDLKIRKELDNVFEVCGTVEAMQGKQKVDGFYFASVVPKPKDIRLYFFPLYTHKEEMGELSAPLQKFLKGKTCFHIKYLDDALIAELKDLTARALELYRANEWIREKGKG